MWRRVIHLFRKPDYRVNAYAHPDLSAQTKLAWYARLKLLLSARRGLDHADEAPAFWSRHRKWLLLVLGAVLAWFLAES
ncbi:MAG: hypothetical protein ACKO8X_04970, partial [Verrucomicrobiota bacterium]